VRTKVNYTDGTQSLTTVTLIRSDSGITALSSNGSNNDIADVLWSVTTNRSAFSQAALTFRYLDSEVSGLAENSLQLYQAPTASGPWTLMGNQSLDTLHNTIGGTVNGFSYFAIKGTAPVISNPIIPISITTTPANGTTGVSVTTVVSARFNKAMNPATINATTFVLNNGASGTISYDAVTQTTTLTPLTNLAQGTRYVATLTTGIATTEDEPLTGNVSWQFTTAGTGGTTVVTGNDGGGGGAFGVAGLLLLLAGLGWRQG